MAPFLWNIDKVGNGRSGRPKSEDRLSDFVLHHLRRDLQTAVIDREVQVRNVRESGIGERTDLKVEALAKNGLPVALIIETKGCWNSELMTAMSRQLRERYLTIYGCRQGIYLVGWFGNDLWGDDDSRKQASRKHGRDLEALRATMEKQAAEVSDNNCRIAAVVLDIHHPGQTD